MLVIINLLIFPTKKIYEELIFGRKFLRSIVNMLHGQICKFQIIPLYFIVL